jgi:phage antirepressor YoqD-like protein
MSSCPPSAQIVPAATPLRIDDVEVRQDAHRRYCLNDLHRASGNEPRHRPAEFLRIGPTVELVAELARDPRYGQDHIGPVEAIRGGPLQSTYVCRELVYAYAMWVSPSFHLKVIRTFDAVVTAHQVVLPQNMGDALELAAKEWRRAEAEKEQRLLAEATIAEQAPKVEAFEKLIDADGALSLRNTAKALKVPERQFIAQLLAWQVLYREKDERLCAYAEHVAAGYFATALRPVTQGETTKVRPQTKVTPKGVEWLPQRFSRLALGAGDAVT